MIVERSLLNISFVARTVHHNTYFISLRLSKLKTFIWAIYLSHGQSKWSNNETFGNDPTHSETEHRHRTTLCVRASLVMSVCWCKRERLSLLCLCRFVGITLNKTCRVTQRGNKLTTESDDKSKQRFLSVCLHSFLGASDLFCVLLVLNRIRVSVCIHRTKESRHPSRLDKPRRTPA